MPKRVVVSVALVDRELEKREHVGWHLVAVIRVEEPAKPVLPPMSMRELYFERDEQ